MHHILNYIDGDNNSIDVAFQDCKHYKHPAAKCNYNKITKQTNNKEALKDECRKRLAKNIKSNQNISKNILKYATLILIRTKHEQNWTISNQAKNVTSVSFAFTIRFCNLIHHTKNKLAVFHLKEFTCYINAREE